MRFAKIHIGWVAVVLVVGLAVGFYAATVLDTDVEAAKIETEAVAKPVEPAEGGTADLLERAREALEADIGPGFEMSLVKTYDDYDFFGPSFYWVYTKVSYGGRSGQAIFKVYDDEVKIYDVNVND